MQPSYPRCGGSWSESSGSCPRSAPVPSEPLTGSAADLLFSADNLIKLNNANEESIVTPFPLSEPLLGNPSQREPLATAFEELDPSICQEGTTLPAPQNDKAD